MAEGRTRAIVPDGDRDLIVVPTCFNNDALFGKAHRILHDAAQSVQ